MYQEEIIDNIQIVTPYSEFGKKFMFENLVSNSKFIIDKTISRENEIFVLYIDPFNNLMSNRKNLKLTINNNEVIQFKDYRSQVSLSNDMTVTILPMKDIQEIANKTFYEDNQRQVVDFVNSLIFGNNGEITWF